MLVGSVASDWSKLLDRLFLTDSLKRSSYLEKLLYSETATMTVVILVVVFFQNLVMQLGDGAVQQG